MNLDDLLNALKEGTVAVEDVKKKILKDQLQEMGDVVIDLQREARCGLQEVVYGKGKTVQQIIDASQIILNSSDSLLVTRVDETTASTVIKELGTGQYNSKAQCIYKFGSHKIDGKVLILTAGTSDVGVAEEALLVCRMFGIEPVLKPDVGVAGLSRLLSLKSELHEADCIIVCAGMEGALPSVVGGLVSVPVIAVPVSSGYGASLGGISALLGMLNSCASGLTVVNIDNGFGAGYAAGRIIKMMNDR
jgi:NCAIR mutase (PurE)-related protein